jgi:hypothetical protein
MKVLWCGGSHLGNAKPIIASRLSHIESEYYITAGPTNRDWAASGGRYSVKDHAVVGNAAEPSRLVNLARYDKIIFVGQYIQPQRYFNKNQIISESIAARILEQEVILDRPNGFFNEPISLFAENAPCKCILIAIHSQELIFKFHA